MQVRQCDFCRMPYQSYGKKICNDCLLEIDEDFILIREYLYDHDRAGIEEVSEATGVTRKTIIYLLKEERLIVGDEIDGGGGFLKCESCKKPINTGKMCAACKKEIAKELQESVSTAAPIKKSKRVERTPEEDNIKGVAKLQVKGGKWL